MRKGQLGFIKEAVIFVVVLLAVIGVYLAIKAAIVKMSERESCITSISTHVALVSITRDNIATYVKCPTEKITIEKKTKELDAKRELAESMRRCWKNWGEGTYTLFKEEGIYCHVCSHITFEDKTKEYRDYEDYLMYTPMEGEKISYFMYFNSIKEGDATRIFKDEETKALWNKQSFDINTNNDYATIFVYVKGRDTIRNWLYTVGAGKSAQYVGGALLATGWFAGIAAGTIAAGAGISATGIGLPVGIIVTAAGGILFAGGYLWEKFSKDFDLKVVPESHFAGVVLLPLTEGSLENLGCQYAYAET